jgi:hypothetical protein
MCERRYTVCTYYPDLSRPERSFDFAVIASSPDSLALAGVDLAALGLSDDNPFAQRVIENSFEVMARRVEETPGRQGSESVFDVLDRLVAGNQSNIQYRPFQTVRSEVEPADLALGVLREVGLREKFWGKPTTRVREKQWRDAPAARSPASRQPKLVAVES